jgi:tetratricopeptide (TPR) repeat protein
MDQFSAHLDRGWDLVSRGDFEGAQQSAEKSLELDAESPEAHNLLGYVHAALGDTDAALEHYREAIALDDSFVEAMLNAAEVLIHPVHDFQGALDMIDEALDWAENDEEVADALLLKFDAYMHQGDREQARKVLRTLPEGEMENPRVEFMIGRALFEVGEPDAARPRLERAIKGDPDNGDAHYYLGLTHEVARSQEDATVAFLRSRELDLLLPRVPWALPAAHFERITQRAIDRVADSLKPVLDGALVVLSDVPGVEVVAEGVDPRAAMLLDALSPKGATPRAGRVFVYQLNVERLTEGMVSLEEDLVALLEAEIRSAFPHLAETDDEDE